MLRFEVTSKQAGNSVGSVRIAFKGHLTYAFVSQFNREINSWLLKGVHSIELDFQEITYLDSPGIGAVVSASQLCRSLGGSARIINTRRLIRHLFKSAKLDQELTFGSSDQGWVAPTSPCSNPQPRRDWERSH